MSTIHKGETININSGTFSGRRVNARLFFLTGAAVVILAYLACMGFQKSQRAERKLLGRGEKARSAVLAVERALKADGFSPGNVDGAIDLGTRNAIREFQKANGLKVTGFVNRRTLGELDKVLSRKPFSEGKKVEKKEEKPVPLPAKRADRVKNAQEALKKAGFEPGPIDGVLGPKTVKALKAFQKANGLVPDGKLGDKTWGALSEYLTKS
ncbi:MAG: peptidoglycan-binding protein [Candidatus Omnitrophica bacterium]|nr:peptidoglycan-binding protein [Candidatus Omnitrophota bacterium]